MQKGDDFNNSSNILDRTFTNWMFAYILLAIVVGFLTPYPISLIISLVIITFTMVSIRASIMMKKSKLDETNLNNNIDNKSGRRIRGIFEAIALSLYEGPIKQGFRYDSIKFYCMYCGKDHKKRQCPRCGSMSVRAG